MRFHVALLNRATYVFMITSSTNALSLCIECTFDVGTRSLAFEISCDPLRQSGDFRKGRVTNVTFEHARRKGEGRQGEEGRAA